jgi:threonine/homoserine/homoserine lactone efflux protein
MSPEQLLPIVLFMVSSSITPGPNNTMLMTSGVHFGVRRSMRHFWGVQIGFAVLLLSVGLGLHGVLAQFPLVFDAVRYLGAAYMLVIAWKLARSRAGPAQTGTALQPMGFWAALGFQWLNPKAWVMAVTCMGNFLPPEAGVASIGLLALLFIAGGGPCSLAWVAFGSSMRQWLENPLRLRVFNIAMALALAGSIVPMLRTPLAG